MAQITPVESNASVKAEAPSAANPITAGAVASSNNNSNVNSSTSISSLADLKKKAPQVYNMMLQSLAMNICNEMKHHQENLKKLMREGQKQNR